MRTGHIARRLAVSAATVLVVTVLAVDPALAQSPKRGGVFRVPLLDVPNLDPHLTAGFLTQTPASLVYSQLVRFPAGPEQTSASDDRIVPDLAEKWEYTSPTTVVFYLRKGVRFHRKRPVNGREVTADNVKYSLDRFRSRSTARGRLDAVQSIEFVDRYTVRIVLREPFAPLLNHLANPAGCAILPREAEAKFVDFNHADAMIGIGPFVLKSYQKGVRLVFEKN